MTYNIRYVELDSNRIVNLCGPERLPVGWTPDIIKKRQIETQKYIDRSKEFYEKLEKSILSEGLKNPILVTAGFFSSQYFEANFGERQKQHDLWRRIPPDLQSNKEQVLICEKIGGNRLYLAQKHNLSVKCIVSDFVNMFDQYPLLKTEQEILSKFQDLPSKITLTSDGVWINGSPQHHLKTNSKNGNYKVKYVILNSNKIENVLEPDNIQKQKLEKENQFFSKLENSILQQGIRNPIVVNAFHNKIIPRYGGSRLMIAQKYNMDIPCIVADFDNVFPNAKEINLSQAIEYFIDKPKYIYMKPNGINCSGCEHVHLGE